MPVAGVGMASAQTMESATWTRAPSHRMTKVWDQIVQNAEVSPTRIATSHFCRLEGNVESDKVGIAFYSPGFRWGLAGGQACLHVHVLLEGATTGTRVQSGANAAPTTLVNEISRFHFININVTRSREINGH